VLQGTTAGEKEVLGEESSKRDTPMFGRTLYWITDLKKTIWVLIAA
jgi:hypothetical protein